MDGWNDGYVFREGGEAVRGSVLVSVVSAGAGTSTTKQNLDDDSRLGTRLDVDPEKLLSGATCAISPRTSSPTTAPS